MDRESLEGVFMLNDGDGPGGRDDASEPEADGGQTVVLPAPPAVQYSDPKTAVDACNAFAKHYGYALVRKGQRYRKIGEEQHLISFRLECQRHGQLTNWRKIPDDQRKHRNRSSMRMGCKMRVVVAACDRNNPSGMWEVRHPVESKGRESLHNHLPDSAIELFTHRQAAMTGDLRRLVIAMDRAGVSVSQTMQVLYEIHPDLLVTVRDIHNIRWNARKGTQNL